MTELQKWESYLIGIQVRINKMELELEAAKKELDETHEYVIRLKNESNKK